MGIGTHLVLHGSIIISPSESARLSCLSDCYVFLSVCLSICPSLYSVGYSLDLWLGILGKSSSVSGISGKLSDWNESFTIVCHFPGW